MSALQKAGTALGTIIAVAVVLLFGVIGLYLSGVLPLWFR